MLSPSHNKIGKSDVDADSMTAFTGLMQHVS